MLDRTTSPTMAPDVLDFGDEDEFLDRRCRTGHPDDVDMLADIRTVLVDIARSLRAISGLVCTGVVVALMLLGYAPLARALERVPGLGPRLTTVVAYSVAGLITVMNLFLIYQQLFG